MTQPDEIILAQLREDPEAGMVQLVEQFTPLVWAVIARHLSDPEDIKECVNDVFTEFYQKRRHFDAQKGSLKTYLAMIAQRRAIDCWRKNSGDREHPANTEIASDGLIDRLTEHAALEDALDQLDPQDAAIIRMKYYDGMTAQEIAASMHLPYETVKKRHQRSLGKLKKFLIAGLVLALLGLLAACAYMVLRYFGVIPGYGVNTHVELPFYVLEETAAVTEERFSLEMEDAQLIDGTLELTLLLEKQGDWESGIFYEPGWEMAWYDAVLQEVSLQMGDTIPLSGSSISPADVEHPDPDRWRVILTFAGCPLPQSGAPLAAQLSIGGKTVPFALVPATQEDLGRFSYDLTAEGGLLAIPRWESGRLLVELYPLDTTELSIAPGLVRSICEGIGGPTAAVTATAQDGTVLTGEALGYNPYTTDAYLTWDFGPAAPGAYTITVPYVYLTAPVPEDFALTVSDAEGLGESRPIPGGTLTVTAFSAEIPEGAVDASTGSLGTARYLCVAFEADRAELTLVGLAPTLTFASNPMNSAITNRAAALTAPTGDAADFLGLTLRFATDEANHQVTLTGGTGAPTEVLTYRWDHSFTIPIVVSP